MSVDKVYVVTEGSYSDYRIVDVYVDKGEAEKHADAIDYDGMVEEYEISRTAPETVDVRKCMYICTFDGETVRESDVTTAKFATDRQGDPHPECEGDVSGGYEGVTLTVEGSDVERVGKVFSEKKAQVKALAERGDFRMKWPVAANRHDAMMARRKRGLPPTHSFTTSAIVPGIWTP